MEPQSSTARSDKSIEEEQKKGVGTLRGGRRPPGLLILIRRLEPTHGGFVRTGHDGELQGFPVALLSLFTALEYVEDVPSTDEQPASPDIIRLRGSCQGLLKSGESARVIFQLHQRRP